MAKQKVMVGNSCSTIKKALVLVFMPSYFNTAPSRESVIFVILSGFKTDCMRQGYNLFIPSGFDAGGTRHIFGPAGALSVANAAMHRPNREAVTGL
ncbi:hypothetical protein KJ068_00790 [bacterium]|nr:hypothetical protein [bacterium]